MTDSKRVLAEFKQATDRLDAALTDTVLAWPYMPYCWIDQLRSEPTIPLENHKLRVVNGKD